MKMAQAGSGGFVFLTTGFGSGSWEGVRELGTKGGGYFGSFLESENLNRGTLFRFLFPPAPLLPGQSLYS